MATTSNKSKEVAGKLDAKSRIMDFGKVKKQGYKIGDDWYNFIGKEDSINDMDKLFPVGADVIIGYENHPWETNDGELKSDFRIKTMMPASMAELSVGNREAEKAESKIDRLPGPDKNTEIRREALLKVACVLVAHVEVVGDKNVNSVVNLTTTIAEKLEQWVMA